jgi:hypothetical protein
MLAAKEGVSLNQCVLHKKLSQWYCSILLWMLFLCLKKWWLHGHRMRFEQTIWSSFENFVVFINTKRSPRIRSPLW